MRLLAFAIIFGLAASLQAQRLSTPLEILDFMEASDIDYEVGHLFQEIPYKRGPVLPHGIFIDTLHGREYAVSYSEKESPEIYDWRIKAREAISTADPNYKKSRRFLEKILEAMPQHAQAYTLMGQTYFEEGDLEAAKPWLTQALERNPVDYLAYWLLAEIYWQQEQRDAALDYITRAHVYNRNYPRLWLRLKEMYQEQGKDYHGNWAFHPQYQITHEEAEQKVYVFAKGIWFSYAIYKAVWAHEEGYEYIKNSQATTSYLMQEELEATLGLYLTYAALEEADKRDYPTIKALEQAIDHDLLHAFVMYEILLPQQPSIANHITELFMQEIKTYIQTVRQQDLGPSLDGN